MRNVIVNDESVLIFTVGWTKGVFRKIIVFNYPDANSSANLLKSIIDDDADEFTEFILRNTSPMFLDNVYKRLKNHFEGQR